MRSTAPPWRLGCASTSSRRRRRRARRRSGQDRPQGCGAVGAAAARGLARFGRGPVGRVGGGPCISLAHASRCAPISIRLRHRVSKLLLRYGRVYDGGGDLDAGDTGVGSPRSASSRSRPSSPTSTRSPRSTGCSPAGPHSTSGSRVSLPSGSGGRPSPGCVASAASRRSRRSCSASRDRRLRPLPAPRASSPPGSVSSPRSHQSGESRDTPGSITKTGSGFARRHPGRSRLALPARAEHRRNAREPPRRPARPHPPDRLASPAPSLPTAANGCARAANPATSLPSPPHANSPASSGPQPSPTDPIRSRLRSRKTPGPKLPALRLSGRGGRRATRR